MNHQNLDSHCGLIKTLVPGGCVAWAAHSGTSLALRAPQEGVTIRGL